MKLNHLQRPSFIRLGIAEALIVILTVVLYLPVAFARHRGAGGDFGVFRVTGTSEVTFSGIRVENGKLAGIAAGGAIAHDGTGIVNTLASPNVNGSPLPKSFGNLAPASGPRPSSSSPARINRPARNAPGPSQAHIPAAPSTRNGR